MLYLGSDLHRKQMTVSLRNEADDVLLRRQVSKRWPKVEQFREHVRQAAAAREKYVAVVEVCVGGADLCALKGTPKRPLRRVSGLEIYPRRWVQLQLD